MLDFCPFDKWTVHVMYIVTAARFVLFLATIMAISLVLSLFNLIAFLSAHPTVWLAASELLARLCTVVV